MSSSTARNIFFPTRADCTAYRGLRGDIVTSLANDFVGIVQNPAAAPTEITTASFVPTNDNLTDLGDATHTFRRLFLGTGIRNPLGNLTIDLQGGGTTILTIDNSGAGVAALGVSGGIAFGGDLSPDFDNTQDIGGPTQRVQTLHIGTSIVATGPGGLFINCEDGGNTTLQIGNNGVGVCNAEVDGYVKAGQSARLTGSGAFLALLNGGQGAGLQVTDVLGSVNGVNVAAAATGDEPELQAYGTDADVGIVLRPKGTGEIVVRDRVRIGGVGGALVGFFNTAPVARPGAIADAAGGVTIDTEARAAINALLAASRGTTGLGWIDG